MAFISKILVFKSSLFNKGGVCATYATQKFVADTRYFEPYSKVQISQKDSGLKLLKRYASFNPAVKSQNSSFVGSKLVKLNLPFIVNNAKNLPTSSILAAFHKLCIIYHTYKKGSSFQKELQYFIKSEVFESFCKILEKELPKFSPPSLIVLLNLVLFGVSPESIILKKVFTLILDNLNCFTVCDLLELYSEVNEKFSNDIIECKNIKEACELYFDSSFEDEIAQCHFLDDLIYFVSDKNLPLKVRKLLVEKCLDKIESGNYFLPSYAKFFSYAFNEPLLSIYKSQLLEKLKMVMSDYQGSKAQLVFSNMYKRKVEKYDFLYDEELCQKFAKNICLHGYNYTNTILTLRNLCEVGHFSQELLNKTADLILSTNLTSHKPKNVFFIGSSFMRNSFHEMNYPSWNKIKSLLESYNALKNFDYTSEIFDWFEYLTFLECDVTDSLQNIFNKVNADYLYETNSISRSLLRLHHSVKKRFPDSNLGLSKRSLNNHLQNSIYKASFYYLTCIAELFGSEDYILFNCLSADSYFFPFVAVLGPDNKPIDLSSYKTKNQDKNFKLIINIDNIEKPPGSKVIAFVEYPDHQPLKFHNAPLTSGYLRMFMKSYESIVNTVNIVLLLKSFFLLRPEEKLNYLKSEVNKIIENSKTAK